MTDDFLGVEHLEAREGLANVTGFEHLLTRHRDGSLFGFNIFGDLLEVHLLEIEDNVCYILFNSGNGIKFVLHPVNLYRCDGIALERRKKNAAQSVSDSDTIAGLQRLKLKLAVEVVSF